MEATRRDMEAELGLPPDLTKALQELEELHKQEEEERNLVPALSPRTLSRAELGVWPRHETIKIKVEWATNRPVKDGVVQTYPLRGEVNTSSLAALLPPTFL